MRLKMIYTDAQGRVIEFSDGSGSNLVSDHVRLCEIRQLTPQFFKHARGTRERVTLYRGFLIARHDTPSGKRESVLYAWDLNTKTASWIAEFPTNRKAREMVNRFWAQGWVGFDRKGYITLRTREI